MRLTADQRRLASPLDAAEAFQLLGARPDWRGQALVCCPAHDDSDPSLSVREDADRPDGILVNCFAGCDGGAVLAAIRALRGGGRDRSAYRLRAYAMNRTVFRESDPPERYEYPGGVYKAVGQRVLVTDDGGVVVLKERAKSWMRAGYPDRGTDTWYRPPGVDPALAPMLWVTSSESDAAALTEAGYPALSVPGGDNGPLPPAAWSAGTAVTVVGDNDASGRRWASLAAREYGAPVVFPPEPFKDAREALEAGERGVAAWGVPQALEEPFPNPGGASPPESGADAAAEAALRLERVRVWAREQVAEERRAERARANAARLLEGAVGVDELLARPPLRFVLEGLLPEGGVVLVAGKQASLKSFLALDWACHVAAGVGWFGREVAPGDAFYIAAEGGGGLGQRLRAWISAHGGARLERLSFYPDRVDLGASGACDLLLQWLARADRPRLLVVDTLRKVSGGLDENSVEIGRVLDNLDGLRKVHPGLAVIVIHHLNKGGGVRGSSALEGDADTVLIAERSHGLELRLRVEKQKDGHDGVGLIVRFSPVGDSLAVASVGDAPVSESGLTALQLQCLQEVRAACRGAASVAQAALAPSRDRSDVSKAVQALVGRGCVEYTERPPGANANSKWLRPTREGQPVAG